MNPKDALLAMLHDPVDSLRCAVREVPQWAWFALGIDASRVGYGRGPLAWRRASRHRCLERPVHICLLEPPGSGPFGRMTAFSINERSACCRASLNEGVEEADVVWTYCQDPLSDELKARLRAEIGRARPDARVINDPDFYNSYHETGVFGKLTEAGAPVPRTDFGEADKGRTLVVYKQIGAHSAPKELTEYDGPRPGYRAFEFVDGRDAQGRYARYRGYYMAGLVGAGTVVYSSEWNAYSRTYVAYDRTFQVQPAEEEGMRRIAEALNIQYFATDFLRRRSDGMPVFVDINVYPRVLTTRSPTLGPRYYGQWHSFGVALRFGGLGPGCRSLWDLFDEAMLRFAGKAPP